MRTMRVLTLAALLLAVGALIVGSVGDAYAQRGRPGGPGGGTGQYQYVIKFLCGQLFFNTDLNPSGQRDGAPGQYYTDINIHNPNDAIVRVHKKFAYDGPKAQLHGPVTSVEEFVLDPDEALQIQCTDIRRLKAPYPFGADAPAGGQFLQGFVVILSRVRLDITAIYTVCPAQPETGPVVNLDLSCQGSNVLGEGVQSLDVVYITEPSPVAAPNRLLPQAVSTARLSGGTLQIDLNARRLLALQQARLMVYDANGRLLHDSGFTTGTRLTWRPQTADGRPLANGVYFYAVMVQDVFGRIGYYVDKFVVLR